MCKNENERLFSAITGFSCRKINGRFLLSFKSIGIRRRRWRRQSIILLYRAERCRCRARVHLKIAAGVSDRSVAAPRARFQKFYFQMIVAGLRLRIVNVRFIFKSSSRPPPPPTKTTTSAARRHGPRRPRLFVSSSLRLFVSPSLRLFV